MHFTVASCLFVVARALARNNPEKDTIRKYRIASACRPRNDEETRDDNLKCSREICPNRDSYKIHGILKITKILPVGQEPE